MGATNLLMLCYQKLHLKREPSGPTDDAGDLVKKKRLVMLEYYARVKIIRGSWIWVTLVS